MAHCVRGFDSCPQDCFVSLVKILLVRIQTERWQLRVQCLLCSWGRWTDILSHGRYKRQLTEQDVETICRTILVYCLNHYRGDENIKSFIWDLITPTADGQTRALVNHSGKSAFTKLVVLWGSQKAPRNLCDTSDRDVANGLYYFSALYIKMSDSDINLKHKRLP